MKTFRLRPLVLLVLALAAPAAAQDPDVEPGAEAARRRPRPVGNPVLPGVWRLEGNDPSLSHADLEPLRQVIGKATVVGLGESIHTSGGYYRMKHRVFRFLVERMGFRVFAFESPWENAEAVARFVETCEGSPEDVLVQGLFGVWASEETRDLVQWMCDWNRTHRKKKDKLHFFGFDIQQPWDDGPALIAFLQRIGLPGDDPRIAGIRKCEGVELRHAPPIPEADHQQCIAALDGVGELFAREPQSIIQQTSKADFEWAKIRQVGLRAWQFQIWWQRDGRAYSSRDEGMAYAFQAIRGLRFPKAKVAVWAHNSHISKAPRPFDGGIPMGVHLARALGKGYVNLGLAAHDVSIDWPEVGCGPVELRGDTLEQILHDLGSGDLLVDLDFPRGRPPLLPPDTFIMLGNAYMVPRNHFDGLLYLEVSPAMAPLRWAACR